MWNASEEEKSDIINVLDEEHAALRRLADAVVDGPEDGGTALLRWSDLMVRHEAAEGLVVYPVLLSYGGGAAVVDSRLEDQTRVEQLLDALEHREPGTPEFEADAVRLVQEHMAHMGMEDAQVIPILSSRLRRRRKAELGKRFRQVSRISTLHRPAGGSRGASSGYRVGVLAAELRAAGVAG